MNEETQGECDCSVGRNSRKRRGEGLVRGETPVWFPPRGDELPE